MRTEFGVYTHVPFCRVHCPYCTFYTVPQPEAAAMGRFARALQREWTLRVQPRLGRGDRLATLYLGGGTPSDLPPHDLVALLAAFAADVPGGLHAVDEVTVECNPESTTPDMLRALRRIGVGRISLGLQALDDRDLQVLGRASDAAANRAALAQVAARFPTWNADLILGVPGTTRARLESALEEIAAAGTPHLSFYCLEMPPGQARALGDPLTDASEGFKADLYEFTSEWLESHGYVHYEISNAARPGHAARHNGAYWRGVEYVGLGPGAHSYAGDERRANRADLAAYLHDLEAGHEPGASCETLDTGARRREHLLLGLRRRHGLEVASLAPRPAARILESLQKQGLARLDGGRIRLTPRGWLVSDSIVLQLLAA
jgi:oxygen-independent coproporphyrinogen-3 oxidase